MKSKMAVFVCLVALVAAGCSSSKKSSSSTSGGSTTTEASNGYGGGYGGYGGGSSTSSSTAASASTVKTAAVGKYGQILVAADGRTLYLFEKDTGTTSACATDPCKTVWPAFTGPASPGDGVTASMLSTANGQVANQVVYNGHLLYEFSGDKAAGDVNGTKIPSWYPVSPAGDKVDKD